MQYSENTKYNIGTSLKYGSQSINTTLAENIKAMPTNGVNIRHIILDGIILIIEKAPYWNIPNIGSKYFLYVPESSEYPIGGPIKNGGVA